MGKQRIERKNKQSKQENQNQEIDNVEFASDNDIIDEINLEDKDNQHNQNRHRP